jgi:hypothetical protein
MNAIIGTGLCASGALSSLSFTNVKLYGDKSCTGHTKINSHWRDDPIVSNNSLYGLSRFYHGVTPGEVLVNPEYKIPLSELGLPTVTDFPAEQYNFVPYIVPRPKRFIKRVEVCADFSFESLLECNNVYLCSSVIGNINYLDSINYIDSLYVGDHINCKIAHIRASELDKKYHSSVITKSGVFSPVINSEKFQISFRPKFFSKSIDVNFIDNKFEVNNMLQISLYEKILTAVYLKFGILFFQPIGYDVFLQSNIDDAYIYSQGNLFENESNKSKHEVLISEAYDTLSDMGVDFRRIKCNAMSGIHLHYDRSLLENLPDNIHVFDTSLYSSNAKHSSVASFCESYNYTSKIRFLDNAG